MVQRTNQDGPLSLGSNPYNHISIPSIDRSYGACIDPSFDSNRLALLERGIVFAIAHIRGGGEMGRAWCVLLALLRRTVMHAT